MWAQRTYTGGEITAAFRSNQSGTNKVTYLVGDDHGTSSLALNADTAQTFTKRYATPFGADRGASLFGPWPGDKGFLGKTRDATTGLTHVGAREYDPTVGQFISVDPVLAPEQPQSLNGYSYAGNNPVTYADPTGLKFCADDFVGYGGIYHDVNGDNQDYCRTHRCAPRGDSWCWGGRSSVTASSRQTELGNRASAAYRFGRGISPQAVLNPKATEVVAMWFMGATPSTYHFDDSDRMTQDVKRHIWMQQVRMYLSRRKGTKMGEAIKGLAYKTKYGAAMNGLPLKGMMAGELSDAIYQFFGDDDPGTSEGATRATLGSFDLKAKVVGYNSSTKLGSVEFEITQSMTVKSLTRSVSTEGYTGDAKDPNAVAISDTAREAFPNGQKDLKMTFSWSEEIGMPEPGR